MSIVAKRIFIEELSERLSDKVTAKVLAEIAEALEEQLSWYEVERHEREAEKQEFEEVLQLFIDTKKVEGKSKNTTNRYRYILRRYFEKDRTPIREITVHNLRQYMASEKERGIADRTIRGYRDIFRSFFGWAYREGILRRDPCANLNPVKCKKELRMPFTDVDIERLKEHCTTLRDKALIAFLLSTGCRISEVCSLNRYDVDFRNLECTVLGKGNKERTVYLDSVCAMQLQNYLMARTDHYDALFVGKGTERLQPGGVRKRLNEIGDEAGVEDVYPHRFRRTLATNLINRGMSIQEVAAILGHERIDTTMTYVYVDKVNVKNAYHKYA